MPLSYGALLDVLNLSWKEHVRARRSSVVGPAGGIAPPPSTLDQALRLWCLAVPEVEATDALREALERAWEDAQRQVGALAAQVEASPPPLCVAAATADEAAMQDMRLEAQRVQRACKAAAKGSCTRLRLSTNSQLIAKLKGNAKLLDEQLLLVRSHRESLADVMSGISQLAAAAPRAPAAAAAGALDSPAMLRATLAQRQAQLASAAQARVHGEARAAEAATNRARLAAELAAASASLDRARSASAVDDLGSQVDSLAISAAVERSAEADILTKVCGFSISAVTAGSVTLDLAGGLFRVHAAYADNLQAVVATAEVVPAGGDAVSSSVAWGRSRSDRLTLAAHLASPLTSSGTSVRDAAAPLALRCARAADMLSDLEDCVCAFPRLVVTVLSPEQRTVQLKFSINQPEASGARRPLTARETLPAGADPQGAVEVDVVATVGAAHMRDAAHIGADCVAVTPGLRRLQRICRVLHADLLQGVQVM